MMRHVSLSYSTRPSARGPYALVIVCIVWFGLAGLAPNTARAVDFLRGDANGDGEVTVSDAHRIAHHRFGTGVPPACMDAADFNDDGKVNVTDVLGIFQFRIAGKEPPSAPYPEPGPDPTPDDDIGECSVYGDGAPLEDPAARITLQDAVAPGGDQASAHLILRVTSSTAIAGYSARIELPPGIVSAVSSLPEDLSTAKDASGLRLVSHDDSDISIGYLASIFQHPPVFIEPGETIPVAALTFCLESGTPAGRYPLEVAAVELVDHESGRAIPGAGGGAMLTVGADVTGSDRCEEDVSSRREPINVVFRLENTTALPGGDGTVPFIIRSDESVGAYSFSVDFDETILQATDIEEVWEKPAGNPDYDLAIYNFNNRDDNPGSAGVDEGFITGAVIFDFHEPVVMPSDTDNVALRFRFHVDPEVREASTTIRFLDGAHVDGEPVRNRVTAGGGSHTPRLAESLIFINGVLQVLPDITVFIRGDANGDRAVDLSDALATLGFLFRAEEGPACYDAADANDDGRIDMADPIATLQSIFVGTGPLPAPFPEEGEDPTADGMGCLYRDP